MKKENLHELIKKAAVEYRKAGLNVISLRGYSKNPATCPLQILYIENGKMKKGWKPLEKRMATDQEFEAMFNKSDITGVGVITGAASNLYVIDIDSYRKGGLSLTTASKRISRTTSGGQHGFFQHNPAINQIGARAGVHVEGKGEGGFVALPPTRAYRKDENGRQTKEIGEYNWERECPWGQLTPITKEIVEPILAVAGIKEKRSYETLIGSAEGSRHEDLRTLALKQFNHFPQKEWGVAEKNIRTWAKETNPPHDSDDVEKIIKDTQEFIKANPKGRHSSRTEAPQVKKQKLLDQPVTYEEAEAKVMELIPGSQAALRVVLAVAISGTLSKHCIVMLWLLLVDVPSSGKTDFVRAIKDSPFTKYLDSLTQNAFVSGERETESQKVHDLLSLLNNKCLVVKDWTSIFSQDEKATRKILGDLVNIYDREFEKHSSRRGTIGYEAYFSHLGCITPATLNKHTRYMNMVGARFLCYKMPEQTAEQEENSYTSIFSGQDRLMLEKEARLYVSSYLDQLATKPFEVKSLSSAAQTYLRIASNITAKCRGTIILQQGSFRDETSGREVKYYDVVDSQTEKPWRALLQLIALARCLAFVAEKDEVGTEELAIIKEVVLSSMPADRSRALRALQEHNGLLTAKELADSSNTSYKTSQRLLEELNGLGVLAKIKGTGAIATDYKIKDELRNFICLDTTDFLSTYSSGTETPHSIQDALPGENKEEEDEPFPY